MVLMNARMYSAVSPAAAAAWRTLLTRVAARADVDWPILDHAPPAPIASLWDRADLGLVQMCGLPWSLREPRPRLLAAPLWNHPRAGGRPVYWSELVVAADSPLERLEDTFGGRAGYTVPDSQSGCVAFRSHLAALPAARARLAAGQPLYRTVTGGLVTPRRIVEAVAAGDIDVGPVDAYAFALLAATEPALAARVRPIASTAATPMPPFVATASLDGPTAARVRAALLESATDPALAGTLATLRLTGFAPVEPAYYEALLDGLAASRALADRWGDTTEDRP